MLIEQASLNVPKRLNTDCAKLYHTKEINQQRKLRQLKTQNQVLYTVINILFLNRRRFNMAYFIKYLRNFTITL